MKPKAYVTRRIPLPGLELVSEFCEVSVHDHEEPPGHEELLRNVRDKDALICLPTDKINKEVLDAGADLKVISTFSVGFEHIDVIEATRKGIYVGNTPDVLTDATADCAFALLLGAARRVAEADRYVRNRQWKVALHPLFFHGESVWGSTMGIIGFGRIGKGMALRAKGFNMVVFYHDLTRLSRAEEAERGVEYRPLEDLLEESDFVSIHAPLTKETFHLMNETRLRAMKPSAILINTSRGSTVDEAALLTALQEKWIAGAGLDVYEEEPLRDDNPLLGLDNVTLLPHIGSATREARAKMAELSARNLLAVLRGEPPVRWLNPEVARVRPLSLVKMI